ncbi:hypothetical protein [Flagellimonas iocasae]|uniref:Lipoprotein n=1 Tax=Flagellimonas iocasae TaxID=2055905 RepID=A0ABW4Y0L1_9FLAO
MKNIWFVFLALFLFGCPDMGTYHTSYSIVNETKYDVELRFFQWVFGEQREYVFSVSIQGTGLILKRSIETDAFGSNTPNDVFKADSVAVIFNNERVEGHTFLEPFDNSIMDEGDYEINTNQYTYTITEENYNNAIPCDGPCY